ncbi:MAG: hypothetical protein ACOYBW_08835 [Fluviibacter phosphoraccumulans]
MIQRFKRGYTMARQFGRGHAFAALMGLSYMVFRRTPSYKVYWESK